MKARVLDLDSPAGYHRFHPDRSLDFQCNRWLELVGPDAFDEIAAAVAEVRDYAGWITAFLGLAETARAEDRALAGAYYDRAAEFFMRPGDPRIAPARDRFVSTLRKVYEMDSQPVPYGGTELPSYDFLPAGQVRDTVVLFGGFDSYVEEFFPTLAAMAAEGYRVIAFDGPGQGGALEVSGLPMIPEWERPVAAVLDHYRLDDVTLVGISLGGGLAIRAAAFEPRIRRVIADDVLDDFLECMGRQVAPGATVALRVLLTLRARRVVNLLARLAAARKPVADWGIRQGMHITGTATPYDYMRVAQRLTTRSISNRVTADALLFAGAEDHYVPLRQLARQAAGLTRARSVTTRLFTAAEQAQNHCHVGNTGLCVRVLLGWLQANR